MLNLRISLCLCNYRAYFTNVKISKFQPISPMCTFCKGQLFTFFGTALMSNLYGLWLKTHYFLLIKIIFLNQHVYYLLICLAMLLSCLPYSNILFIMLDFITKNRLFVTLKRKYGFMLMLCTLYIRLIIRRKCFSPDLVSCLIKPIAGNMYVKVNVVVVSWLIQRIFVFLLKVVLKG